MEGKREHFGLQIAREGGKPLTDALIEVDRAIDGVRNAADMLRVAAGQEIPMGIVLQAPQKERKAWLAHSAFDGPVILFQDVIEVLYRSVLAVRDSSACAKPDWVSSQANCLEPALRGDLYGRFSRALYGGLRQS